MLLQLIAWLGALIVIGTYAISAKVSNPRIFHWGNFIGCLILVPAQIILAVYFGAFISASFGITAGYALLKNHRNKKIDVS